MSSAEVVIIVEGQTEQTFVRDVLAPEMSVIGVCLHAARIGPVGHKGGNVRFDRAIVDIKGFLESRSDIYVSTMVDFFRIDSGWPGIEVVNQKRLAGVSLSADEKAQLVEAEMFDKVVKRFPELNAQKRFIPYISIHEFEALLFSDESILGDALGTGSEPIRAIVNQYRTPEDINTNPDKAPSKRLESLVPRYRKVVTGNVVAAKIGIQKMRSRCPHFHQWLVRLEALRVIDEINI